MDISIEAIGYISTPYQDSKEVPIQSRFSEASGKAIINPDLKEGLESLDGFSHIYLIYWFHKAKVTQLKVTPYLEDTEHGLFATRAPSRPNPIGLSIVSLTKIEDNVIYFKGADMLDGTPLLDIKPFIPPFDTQDAVRIGWLESALERNKHRLSNARFES